MTLIEVRAWRQAAIQDGWKGRPIYQTESVERAMRLSKEGWEAQTLARPAGPCPNNPQFVIRENASIVVWGPDGLQIHLGTPISYSWERMQALLRRCDGCQKEKVETKRVGFAGRCCLECYPTKKKEIEFPGWCD